MAPPLTAEVQLRNLRDVHIGRTVLDEFNTLVAGAPGAVLLPVPLPALSTAFLDSAAAQVAGGKRIIYLVVATALTWVTSGQATIQPFASAAAFAAAGGAATQLGVNQVKLNAAANLGAAAQVTLPIGLYRFTSGAFADLAFPDPLLGVELVFPSALTGGAAALYIGSAT